MLKLLIFDWDGTLCNSLDRIVECIQLSAEDTGLPVPEPEQAQEIVGLGLIEALSHLFPGIDPQRIQSMRDSYSHHFAHRDATPSPFYPGVMTSLERLREQGYWLAVATGKSRRGLNRVLEAHRMADFFHASRCADETASKPHPKMLHELLDEFGLKPEQAVMVGDTEFDMEMSVNAAVPRIAVSYGAHAADRLHRHNPVACIDQFSDIEPLIERLKNPLN
jgi:phosphoglycolate phosphatase